MTLDGPHRPHPGCEGCRDLFDLDPPRSLVSTTHWRAGWSTIVQAIDGYTPAWLRKTAKPRGQAIVEAALVLPLLLFLLLATLEAGSIGAASLRYTHLADRAADTGTLPEWFDREATADGCTDPVATISNDAPQRLTLTCTYRGIAVPGFTLPITTSALLP